MALETIEVRYKELTYGVFHKYIVYTDSSGNEYYARGGPSVGKAAVRLGEAGSSVTQPLGPIITDYGIHGSITDPDRDVGNDDPRETIKIATEANNDLSADFLAVVEAMDDIEAEGHMYHLQNSNTVVDEALNRAGLPGPTQGVTYLSPGTLDLPSTSVAASPHVKAPYINSGAEPLFGVAQDRGSPLVFDLNDSGTIDLISLANSSAFWDIDQDGFREQSGWVDSVDGVLAYDINENGIIDNNGELFGTMDTDGFTILAQYDSNDDGQITAEDTIWEDLIIWQDTNEDGFSATAELHTLGDFDIVSISLNATEVSATNQGHAVTHTATFTVNDGINPADTRAVHDIWFTFDNVNTVYNEEFTPNELVFYISNLRGYGELPDLHIAMSLDDTGTGNLLEQVATLFVKDIDDIFTADSTILDDVRDIMFRWAGVNGLTGNERGEFIDSRELGFLEKLMGQDFLQNNAHTNRVRMRAKI